MKIYLKTTIWIIFILNFNVAICQIKDLFKNKNNRREQTFNVSGHNLTLSEIIINDSNSNWEGLKICWLKIPSSFFKFQINRVEKDINIRDFINIQSKDDVILLNGGFYNINRKGIGLLIEDSKLLQKYGILGAKPGGGFIVQTENTINIYPINSQGKVEWNGVKFALQSTPIIVVDGKNDVNVGQNGRSNRIGIGLTKNGDIIVCGVVKKNMQAISLYEFGEILSMPEDQIGLGVETFIGLDGGPSVNFYIPAINYFLVANYSTYLPNIIRISSKK